MKNVRSVFLALALLLPVAGVISLAFLKQTQISQSAAVRLPIKGYDPRSPLYGHYLSFTFDGPEAPDQETHNYYIPEDQADELQEVFVFGTSQKIEIDAHLKNKKLIHLGMLYIDGLPWRDYLEKLNVDVRVPMDNVRLNDRVLIFTFFGWGSESHSYEIPREDVDEFKKKLIAATGVVWGTQGVINKCGGAKRVEMDITKRGKKIIKYGMIFFDNKPWREFDDQEAQARNEACKKQLPPNQELIRQY